MQIEFFFQAANYAAKVVLAYDRPALEGSEKQISWASDIRAKFEREAVKGLLRAAGFPQGEGCWLQADDLSDIRAKIEAGLSMVAAGKTFSDHADAFFANTSAKFWIDNRDESFFALLQAAAKAQ